jgi:hypothetical protein
MKDQDLAVAIGTTSDSNCGDLKLFGEEGSEGRVNEFQDNGAHAGLFEGMAITEETLAFRRGFSLDVVATFFDDALGEHPEVANHGDAIRQDRFDHGQALEAAFDFNRIGSGISEESRIGKGEGGSDAAAGRKIAGNEGVFYASGDGSCVMKHIRHGHRGGIRIAKHDHAQRISNEDQIQSAVVEKARGGVIVGCETGEAATSSFGITQTRGGIFQGRGNLEVMERFWQIL